MHKVKTSMNNGQLLYASSKMVNMDTDSELNHDAHLGTPNLKENSGETPFCN